MNDNAKAIGGSAFTWLTTIAQTNEIFQLIQIILASIVSVLTILFIIYKWWKKAKEDGTIEPDEIEELFEQLKEEKNKNEHDI